MRLWAACQGRIFRLTRLLPIVIVAVVFGLMPSNGLTQTSSADADLDSALRLLEEGRTTLDNKSLAAARDAWTRLTQQHPDNALYFYQLARANGYRVEAYAAHGDKRNAERSLDEAVGNIEQSLQLNEKSADAHSLLADLYGRRISFGTGIFIGPKYGPKVQAENRRAIELEPNNPRAFASRGRQHLETPKMFGGDVDKAIADFRRAVELDPKADETFVWLAMALPKKGDSGAADHAVQEALRLNPRSVFAKQAA